MVAGVFLPLALAMLRTGTAINPGAIRKIEPATGPARRTTTQEYSRAQPRHRQQESRKSEQENLHLVSG